MKPIPIRVGGLASASALRCYAGGSLEPTHFLVAEAGEIQKWTARNMAGTYRSIRDLRNDAAICYSLRLIPAAKFIL